MSRKDNGTEVYITKMYWNKVYGNEFKPVHRRNIELDSSYSAVHSIIDTLDYKQVNRLSVGDLALTPDLITLSDAPNNEAVNIKGGWHTDRFSFMMEITMIDYGNVNHIYLSGYTDADDLFGIFVANARDASLNGDINLTFNDCLITQTIKQGNREVTRIVDSYEIIPTPDKEEKRMGASTMRPSDVFATIQGQERFSSDEFDVDGVSLIDTRTQNHGGKVSRYNNASLDNHLVSVSNMYMSAKDEAYTGNDLEVYDDLVYSTREPDLVKAVKLFDLIFQETGEVVEDSIRLGDLLAVCPERCQGQEDFVINDKPRQDRDSEIRDLASKHREFKALTTTDSEGTDVIGVDVKLAQLALAETAALMNAYKITQLALTATNLTTDYNKRPLIFIANCNSLISNEDITKQLEVQFEDRFLSTIFNKISFGGQVSVDLSLYIGFNTEKIELSLNGEPPLVVALPKFMSSSFSIVVGGDSDLKQLSKGYKDLFNTISSNIGERR